MKDLVGRVSALDPDAGAAVKVIAYFDRLGETRAGLEAIVRAAAVLAGCPTRLVDDERHLRIRALPDGRHEDAATPPDPGWPTERVRSGSARLWLERPTPAGPIDAIVLERAAVAARGVLDRAWGGAAGRAPREDPALVELLLNPGASDQARLRAARTLKLEENALFRAVAVAGGGARIERSTTVRPEPGTGQGPPERLGVGRAVPVLELPGSFRSARLALRLTAEGTEQDPGPRVVYADDLGALELLAAAVDPGGRQDVPDVRALDRAGAAAPWMLATLHAVAQAASVRSAAGELTIHHSTLLDRLTRGEHLLGWNVRTPQGRLRLQLAFAVRRLLRHPDPQAPSPPGPAPA
ncbi:helix-turn-helix domain-containing protein [Nonomuraea sp. NPDC050383]|uniref:helix-turn-helix domain-containing protein n=1 Tax=Nonomuraea sp. NPDC050383 TaxID=3364362 RepID=UPI0037AE797D